MRRLKALALGTLATAATLAGCGAPDDASRTNAAPTALEHSSSPSVALRCRERQVVDAGYTVAFFADASRNLVRAQLGKVWFGGTKPLADYTHMRLLSPRAIPDHPQVTQEFVSTAAAPTSYTIGLTSGDFAGIRYAQVDQVADGTSTSLATLPCDKAE